MDTNTSYLVGRVRAYCEKFHPGDEEVRFRAFTFMIYSDGALYVSQRITPACVSVLLEVDNRGVRYHGSEELLHNELLPLLDEALVLEDLADV
ncbi:MAG: hypothetical protein AB7L09_02310 [Nitrospira sp.]